MNLVLTNHFSELYIPVPNFDLASLNAPIALGGAAQGYKVSLKRGSIAGVGASVSGAGAWVRVNGSMSFKLKQVEHSKTYNKMVKEYSISGGVSGFWNWLGFGANAQTYSQQINETLNEVTNSTDVNGTVNVDMFVSGLYPNVQVDASAYVLVMQIIDKQGSVVATTFSDGAPNKDTGSQDSNGQDLPTNQKNNTITIGG
jgi:hypothetical protein